MANTLLREPNPEETELRDERLQRAIKLSARPFGTLVDRGGNLPSQRHRRRYVEVAHRAEVPWNDLLLDVAMVIAFMSPLDVARIQTPADALSYVFLFVLVFWVWATQVAYNIRFRQDDHTHRLFLFLQLLVFGGLAVFSNQFNILSGFATLSNENAAQDALSAAGTPELTIDAALYSASRLPKLAAQGIAFVMFTSRALLLVQYVMVFTRANKMRRTPLALHCSSLGISAISYLASFFVTKYSSGNVPGVGQLLLWYFPIVLDLVAHLLASAKLGSVEYNSKAVWTRYSTLLTLIVGTGLHGLTKLVKVAVEAFGFSVVAVVQVFAASTIVMSFWWLYFDGSVRLSVLNTRSLSWQFLHLPFLIALVLVFQAVGNGLLFQTAYGPFQLLDTQLSFWLANGVAQGLAPAIAEPLNLTLRNLGISLDAEIAFLNSSSGTGLTQAQVVQMLRWTMSIPVTIFQAAQVVPGPVDPISINLTRFNSDDTFTTLTNWENIVIELFKIPTEACYWIAATGGGALIMLAVLNIVQKTPTDRFSWGSFLNRLFAGILFAFFTPFLFGPSTIGAGVWLTSGFMLPSFAILLVLVMGVDWVLLYLAAGTYPSTDASSL